MQQLSHDTLVSEKPCNSTLTAPLKSTYQRLFNILRQYHSKLNAIPSTTLHVIDTF